MNKKKTWMQLAGAGIMVYVFFRFLFFVFLPVILVWLICKFLNPAKSWLERNMHIPRMLSVVGLVTLFYGGSVFFLYKMGAVLVGQMAALLGRLPGIERVIMEQTDGICCWCDNLFAWERGASRIYINEQFSKWCEQASGSVGMLTTSLWNCVKYCTSFVGTVGIMFLLTCLFLWDRERIMGQIKRLFCYEEVRAVLLPVTTVGFAYLKAQAIIIAIVTAVCTICFWYTGSGYALLFGLLVAIMDAFPVLGSGLVLIPAGVIAFLQGKVLAGIAYLCAFVACQLVRQILEPRLIGGKLGIPSFYIVLSVYFGVQLFGVSGVITGPIAFVLLQSILLKSRTEKMGAS